MPKKEYFNLPIEKQNKIYEAAKKEFTSIVYEDASINKIVKDAEISRGSFYCYFENKKDIYLYVMKNEVVNMIDALVIKKQKNKLDLLEASFELYDAILKFVEKKDSNIIKNICNNMKVEFEKDTIDEEADRILEAVNKRVSLDNIKYNSADELKVIVGMVTHCIIENLYGAIFGKLGKKYNRKRLQLQLDIIKNGVNKEEK